MFFHKTPGIIKKLHPNRTWSIPTHEKVIFLTFDDGPIPGLTDFILETLEQYQAKATFFCVGDNLGKHRDVAQRTIDQGHLLGNHTFNHLNGWKTDDRHYIDNVNKCQETITALGQSVKLFRPPYGRIKRSQATDLRQDYRIIMWDALSGDFSARIRRDVCLKKTIKATSKGSIVLFHDNIKAATNLKYTLPRYLDHFSAAGYSFETLE